MKSTWLFLFLTSCHDSEDSAQQDGLTSEGYIQCWEIYSADLSDAETILGVDASTQREQLTALHEVTWSAISEPVTFDLIVSEPDAFLSKITEECPDQVGGISSRISGSVVADGYFNVSPVESNGQAQYSPDETYFWLQQELTSIEVDEGLAEAVTSKGYDPDTILEYTLLISGTVDGGTIDIAIDPPGSDNNTTAMSGEWLPIYIDSTEP